MITAETDQLTTTVPVDMNVWNSDDIESALGGNKNEEESSNETFKCTVGKCKQVLQTKKNLERHIKLHHHKEPKFPCEICDQLFVNMQTVRNHVEQVHKKPKYECEKCGKLAKGERSLEKHVKNFHVETICPRCGDWFSCMNDWRIHNKTCGKKQKDKKAKKGKGKTDPFASDWESDSESD